MCLTTAACLQPVSSAPRRLQRFHHERRTKRTVAKDFVCPLSLVLTGVPHNNKAESRKLQAGDLELLGIGDDMEWLIDKPKAVCSKCINRVKHARATHKKNSMGPASGKENIDPASEIATLKALLLMATKGKEIAEAKAKKAIGEKKVLKRKMSGSSKKGVQS